MRVCLFLWILLTTVASGKFLEEWFQLSYSCQANKLARITPDCKFAVFACEQNVRIVSLTSGKQVQSFDVGSKDDVNDIAITANSTNIVVGVKNCQLQIWQLNPSTNQFERVFTETVGNMLQIISIQLSFDETLVYVGGYLSTVIFNIGSKSIDRIITPDMGVMEFIKSSKHNSLIVFTYKVLGNKVVMAALNHTLPNYTLQDTEYFPNGSERIRPSLSNKQDRFAITLTTKGYSSIYNAEINTELGRLAGHEKSTSIPRWSWNDRYLMTGSADRNIILWDGNTYLEKQRIELGYDINSVWLSCDSKHLFSVGFYTATIFNVTDPTLFGECKDVGVVEPKHVSQPMPIVYISLALVLFLGVGAEAILGSVSGLNTLLMIQGVSYVGWLLSFHHNTDHLGWLISALRWSYLKLTYTPPTQIGVMGNASECVYAYITFVCLIAIITLLKTKINTRPLLVLEMCCKWIVKALSYPILFFLQSAQLQIDGVSSMAPTEQIAAIFASGVILTPMFLQLFETKVKSFCLSLIRLAYCQLACLVLLFGSIQNTIALKLAFLHLLFAVANIYIQSKEPDGPGRTPSYRLTIIQGVLEVSAFVSLAIGQPTGTFALICLSCATSLANAFLLKRALATIKPMAIVSDIPSLSREDSSNLQLSNNPHQ